MRAESESVVLSRRAAIFCLDAIFGAVVHYKLFPPSVQSTEYRNLGENKNNKIFTSLPTFLPQLTRMKATKTFVTWGHFLTKQKVENNPLFLTFHLII